MNPLSALFGGPLKDILKGAADVVDKFVTTDKEKLEAQAMLLEIERQANADLITADVEFAKAQAEVIVSEAKSESWLARNWRPLTMLSFVSCILYTQVIAPLLLLPNVPVPERMWDIMHVGIGGYVAGRSVEKIAPAIVQAISSTTKAKTK